MRAIDRHLTDRELALDAEGEVKAHLAGCAACRERKCLHESKLAEVFEALDVTATAAPGSRKRFIERLHGEAVKPQTRPAIAVLALAAASMTALLFWPERKDEFAPRTGLTPGVARAISLESICAAVVEEAPVIEFSLARAVFQDYGIEDPRPRTYEVDYLIPPDLGGVTDRRNLWPQPYSGGVWNSRVKDALEDRLRAKVCDGSLRLEAAQQDLAQDWIAAYKKHFRTQAPLSNHAVFVKDRPWE